VSRGAFGIWPTLSPLTALRRSRDQLPFPFGEPNLLLSERARHSLLLGLRALGIGDGDEVLTPAYHHGAEVESIVASGATPAFYGGDKRLEPDPEELESLLNPRVRALHLIHYLGFGQDAERWRAWCSERDLLLIEDGAQAWLSERDGRPLGSAGDMAIFCVYKSVGVPDGGALVCSPPAEVETGRASSGLLGAIKLSVRGAAARGLVPRRVVLRDPGEFDLGEEFAIGNVSAPPSRATTALLPRFDFVRVREARRRNYSRLFDRLGESVPEPFDFLAPGVSPWVFPIRAAARDEALPALRAAGLDALNFWSQPHPLLDADRFPKIAERRATTLGLPVHQDLRDRDIDRIADLARDWAG
jgi:dTDP-4-amino-4,6-dideoxygalactose transaminase